MYKELTSSRRASTVGGRAVSFFRDKMVSRNSKSGSPMSSSIYKKHRQKLDMVDLKLIHTQTSCVYVCIIWLFSPASASH